MDILYNTVVSSLDKVSDSSFPKTDFKKYLKPYWNETFSALHEDMKSKRSNWIITDRPRDGDEYYLSYKNAKMQKRIFRCLHRQTVQNYLKQMHEDIDKLAEVDSGIFWREVKSTLFIEGNTFSNLVLIFHVALFFPG